MGEEFPALLGDAVFVLNFGDKQGFLFCCCFVYLFLMHFWHPNERLDQLVLKTQLIVTSTQMFSLLKC